MSDANARSAEADGGLSRVFSIWLAGRAAGSAPDPEELCPDDPTLREQLRHQIAVLQVVEEFGSHPDTTLLDPWTPTAGLPAAGDRYVLAELIARGGMGAVYAARDLVLDRDVAVKLLRDEYPPGSPTAGRFAEEARITSQLQHPGIPPVHDFGTRPDGRPFLAMKLIRGRTLDDLLDERPTPATDRGRFLATFEAVCQAVAYAHANGIVHRDLKPSNVMVGTFGEVQVMDWGLAKVLTARNDAPSVGPVADADTTIRSLRDTDAETRTGAVIGTPPYMPPEQARGELDRVGPRSDVFGLGAVLCVVLTGQPPYAGPSSEAVRELAARAQLADCFARLDRCGAEPELVALCKACLGPDPLTRPADAGVVVAAVAGFRAAAETRAERAELDRARAEVRVAEGRRRQRVWYGLAVVLLVGLAGSLGFAGWAMFEADRAKLEKEKAEKALAAALTANRGRVEALLKMTERLSAEFGSRRVVTDRDRRFLQDLREQWKKVEAIQGSTPEEEHLRLRGVQAVGWLAELLGEREEAEEAYRRALAGYQNLADSAAAGPDDRAALVSVSIDLGRLLTSTRRAAEAERVYSAALDQCRQLAAAPGGHDIRPMLASIQFGLGEARAATKRPAEAEVALRDAVRAWRQLAAESPKETHYREDAANALTFLGNVLADTRRFKEAARKYREALEEYLWLAESEPGDPQLQERVAARFAHLGLFLQDTKQPGAEEAYREAEVRYKRLTKAHSSVPRYWDQLAATYNKIGALLQHDRPAEAERAYQAAIEIQDRLVRDYRDVSDYHNGLAGTLVNLARLRVQQKRFAAAREDLARARPHHQAALKENRNNPTYRQFYRINLWVDCDALEGLRDHAGLANAARELAAFGFDPPADTYTAAAYTARCISLAEVDTSLTDRNRVRLAEEYADQALTLLRRGIEHGFRDLSRLKGDSWFAPLRNREDFRQLRNELEARSKDTGPARP